MLSIAFGKKKMEALYNTNENLKSPMFDNFKKILKQNPRTIELIENHKSIEAIYLGHKFFLVTQNQMS
jgi:hypothetical protein